jgi:hypothetical protein
MNIKKFRELMEALPNRGDLMQESSEWQGFMEFVSGYFGNRGIAHPLVVEIGIYHGAQRAFYERLMGTEYISIDINPEARPDILGDSKNEGTMVELLRRLDGRSIDLLFIDGDHLYGPAKRDYDLYAPLTRHLIVYHDTVRRRDGLDKSNEVWRVWDEMVAAENTITFKGAGWLTPGKQTPLGIGVIIKEQAGE